MYRVEWIRHQEREKKKLEDEKEKERGRFTNDNDRREKNYLYFILMFHMYVAQDDMENILQVKLQNSPFVLVIRLFMNCHLLAMACKAQSKGSGEYSVVLLAHYSHVGLTLHIHTHLTKTLLQSKSTCVYGTYWAIVGCFFPYIVLCLTLNSFPL